MNALVDVDGLFVSREANEILHGVSLGARAGELIAVIGPNGAGKSTLLRAIVGLEAVSAGAVRLHGAPVAALSPIARARSMSYLPQQRPIYWSMPADQIVALGRFAYGSAAGVSGENAAAVDRAIAAADIGHIRHREATSLSGGEAARMHLARALAAETAILIADEPTAALDPCHQLAIMRVLRARADGGGALVIAALHDLALAARFATRIVIIEGGRLTADGAPADVLTEPNLARAFGVRALVSMTGGRTIIGFDDLLSA